MLSWFPRRFGRTVQARGLVVGLSLMLMSGFEGDLGQLNDAWGRAASVGPDCRVVEVARNYLTTPEGLGVYVEPHAAVAVGDGFVLLGQPAYEWHLADNGRATLATSGRFLGVQVQRGVASPIPAPDGLADIRWVDALSIGADRIGVLMEEADTSSESVRDVARVLFAEYGLGAGGAPGTWGPLEVLDPPDSSDISVAMSSPLVSAVGGTLNWATLAERERGGIDVVLYERRADGWAHRVVAESWADDVGLGLDPSGRAIVAVAGLDPGLEYRRRSIRVIDPGSGEAEPIRLDAARSGDRVRTPVFARTGTRLDVAWTVERSTGGGEVRLATGVGSSGGLRTLDPDGSSVHPARMPDGATLWFTNHLSGALGTQEIRVYRDAGAGPVLVGQIPSPFTGPFAALVLSSGDVLVIGPEADWASFTPSVRSLTVRLSVSCTQGTAADHLPGTHPFPTWRRNASPTHDTARGDGRTGHSLRGVLSRSGRGRYVRRKPGVRRP